MGSAADKQKKCLARMPGWHPEGLTADSANNIPKFTATCTNTQCSQNEPGCAKFCLDASGQSWKCAHYWTCATMVPICKAFCIERKKGTSTAKPGMAITYEVADWDHIVVPDFMKGYTCNSKTGACTKGGGTGR